MKKILPISLVALSFIVVTSAFTSDIPVKQTFEAESAEFVNGAFKVNADQASGGYLVRLTRLGAGIIFNHLPVAVKLAIRYSSSGVGLINVVVNNQLIQQVNVHSSGNLTSSSCR